MPTGINGLKYGYMTWTLPGGKFLGFRKLFRQMKMTRKDSIHISIMVVCGERKTYILLKHSCTWYWEHFSKIKCIRYSLQIVIFHISVHMKFEKLFQVPHDSQILCNWSTSRTGGSVPRPRTLGRHIFYFDLKFIYIISHINQKIYIWY